MAAIAYLEGQNIEIMANSDNVLRGGLTNKHIDVSELMRHIRFEETIPNILDPEMDPVTHERVFKTPANDFELSEIVLDDGQHYEWNANTVEIALVFSGQVRTSTLEAKPGEALVATAGSSDRIEATEPAVIYKATIPNSQS